MLKKLSANPLLLNDRIMSVNEKAPIQANDKLSFNGVGTDLPFLELRVILRSRSTVNREGPHPAISVMASTPQAVAKNGGCATPVAGKAAAEVAIRDTVAPQRPPGHGLVLICTSAAGRDVSKLSAAERIIEIPPDGVLEIGKRFQLHLFEQLLKAEPTWLSFISRSHCRVRYDGRDEHQGNSARARSSSRPPASLKVENMSANVVLVDGRKVGKDDSQTIEEGGTFAFVAAPEGREERFLQFEFRRLPTARN